MNRHHEPNASYYSARYAERKRAAERAQDAAAGPRPCNRCRAACTPNSIFCAIHATAYLKLLSSGATPDVCAEFCRRTYWP